MKEATAHAEHYLPESLAEPALNYLIEQIGIEPGPSGEDIPTGRSKISGSPDLPADVEWPMNKLNEPMAFVAQINLEELNDAVDAVSDEPALPTDGLLSFFWDPVDNYDDDVTEDPGRVFYFVDRDLEPRDFPMDKMPKDKTYQFGAPSEFAIAPRSMKFYWGLDTPIDEVGSPEYDEILGYLEDPHHPMADHMREFKDFLYGMDEEFVYKGDEDEKNDDQLGGWGTFRILGVPDPVQYDARDGATRVKGELRDWILLFEAPVSRWDYYYLEGDVYFLIHRDDMAKRDFSKVGERPIVCVRGGVVYR